MRWLLPVALLLLALPAASASASEAPVAPSGLPSTPSAGSPAPSSLPVTVGEDEGLFVCVDLTALSGCWWLT